MREDPITRDEFTAERWDAIVIGAGPAGAMAARELASGGARVLLVERRTFPREKVCGGCLNGRALDLLGGAGLGSLVAQAGGIPLGGFELRFRGRRLQLALPNGAALSRARLDAELVRAAIESGACFLPETQALVEGEQDGARRVLLERRGQAGAASARVVLVASGLGGRGRPPGSAARTRIAPGSSLGAGCLLLAEGPSHYAAGTIFMAVGEDGYVGMVRLEDGCLNLAAALQPELIRRCGSIGAAVSGILKAAGLPPIPGVESARWRGTGRLTRQTHPVAEARLFLLGDAAGYIEPFTGEGIAWALTSGRAIAPLAMAAIARWEPQMARDWDELHRRLVRRRQRVCRAAAAALHRPWLASLGFLALAHLPATARRVIESLNAPPPIPEARPPWLCRSPG